MINYIARRLAGAGVTLLIISFVAFAAIALLPGDPAEVLLGEWATEDMIETLTRQWGLDRPLLHRYAVWLVNVVQGDFGESLLSRRPTSELLLAAWPVTLQLVIMGMLVACAVGIPVGIIASISRPFTQGLLTSGILIAQSIPSFVSGLIMILVVSVHLGWLPASGYVPFLRDPSLNMRTMILPALSLGLVIAGFVARFTRGAMLDVLGSDFIRTARSKGMSQTRCVLFHGFRVALLPMASFLGTQLVWLLGGVIIQEVLFVLPGLGRLIVRSVMNRDYAVIQAVILWLALAAAVVNLFVDLLYGWLDPRIRYE